jgi:hypothetical protein
VQTCAETTNTTIHSQRGKTTFIETHGTPVHYNHPLPRKKKNIFTTENTEDTEKN